MSFVNIVKKVDLASERIHRSVQISAAGAARTEHAKENVI